MIDFNLIILNKNGQHITTKKQRLCDRIRSKISLCANCKKIHFKYKDTNRLKEKGWEKIYHVTMHQKTAGMTVNIKVDFQVMNITRDK